MPRRGNPPIFLLFGLIGILAALLLPLPAPAAILTQDTTWSGVVELAEDLVIPPGRTLTILPGTTILVTGADSTKTDPEALSPLTEITVRGTLQAVGTSTASIRLAAKEPGSGSAWAGILVDGGSVRLTHAAVQDAETGVYLFSGAASLDNCRLQANQTGVVASSAASRLDLSQTRITGNEYGLLLLGTPRLQRTAVIIRENRQEDERQAELGPSDPQPPPSPPSTPVAREIGPTALVGDTLWSGRLVIAGQVRIPDGSRLVIAPGTLIEFRRLDTNGDGIGESGLLIQGVLIAKGTADRPITFRSAESDRRAGDWDAINIMNSERTGNLVEYCTIQDAYRGLHFHFSHVQVQHADFRGNYRGIQFQESTVEIAASTFTGNRSGVQGRDSRVRFAANRVTGNHTGVNFLRCILTFAGNRLEANLREGARIREGAALVERNQLTGNRVGLQIGDLFRGQIAANDLGGNTDVGLSMKNGDNLEVVDNHLGGNGVNGLNLQATRAMIRGNLITGNRQRGIGIHSFSGSITGNLFAANGLYAIENNGSEPVSAEGNWWGGKPARQVVLDHAADPRRGPVATTNPLPAPPTFVWPLPRIPVTTTWSGRITLPQRAAVLRGATPRITPGTVVSFGPASGLTVNGALESVGTPDQRISLTAERGKDPESWDEILLENALGSTLAYTDIEYATWGIHSHFTDLQVQNVRLRHNYGGLRFRSGPVRIRETLVSGNSIGIRSYIGMGEIRDSLITANEIGIFIRERGGSFAIHRNAITGNRSYNLRVGDFNTEDVPAQDNWWGTADPGETIFDSRQETGIGRVLYEPALSRSPLTWGDTP